MFPGKTIKNHKSMNFCMLDSFKPNLGHGPAAGSTKCMDRGSMVSRLHAEASMLRVECSGLAERHWQLCSEIDSTIRCKVMGASNQK